VPVAADRADRGSANNRVARKPRRFTTLAW